MAETISPGTGCRYGVERVCRVWDPELTRQEFDGFAAQHPHDDGLLARQAPALPRAERSDLRPLPWLPPDLWAAWTGCALSSDTRNCPPYCLR